MNKDISKKLKWTKEKLKGEKKNTIRLKMGLETAMKETRVPIVDAIVLKAIYKRVICITKQSNAGNKTIASGKNIEQEGQVQATWL